MHKQEEEEEDIVINTTIEPEDPFRQFPVDPRITYPGYKSMDEFIDVERLTALDGYITSRIKRRLNIATDMQFYTGPYKLEAESLARPGTKMIYLAQSELP